MRGMIDKFGMLFRYLAYLLQSRNEHGIHSPFVFDLYTNVIKPDNSYYSFANIESIRAKMLLSMDSIAVKDFGTGHSLKRKIRDIARYSLKRPVHARLLFRLTNHFQPGTILELGTSLGITTMYLASANKKALLITVEGCPETATIAKQNFKKINLQNIQLINEQFDDALPSLLEQHDTLDLVYFDGNHKKGPTLSYFRQCLNKANHKSVFIFDDIHWSNEMNQAWCEIKSHEKVFVTIDLFFFGIVLLNPELQEQHFVLRH